MKILNFGSLNIDYVYSVDHFVRPGETLSSSVLEQFCGGKGLNQSIAFARAGSETYHAGCIGAEGTSLVSMLRESGVNTKFVRTVPSCPCGHAIIQVTKKGENCILLYGGANQAITSELIEEVFADFESGDLLMLQNEINGLDQIIQTAHAKGMQIALNPSPFHPSILDLDLSLVHWIIFNETEGYELTGETQPNKILNVLLQRYPNMKLILTLGSRGSVYADSCTYAEQPIFSTEVVDTTAAGDTFTGYFFSAVMRGKSPQQALAVASAASAVAVSRKGAAPSIPTPAEIRSSGFAVDF